MLTEEQRTNILKECEYQTSRAGGKGGQNVNKVETKVELGFNVLNSQVLTDEQKQTILTGYTGLTTENTIKTVSAKHRTQLQNKEEAEEKFIKLIIKLLTPVKNRRATKPSRSSKEKKLHDKKKAGEKKSLRQKIR